MCEMKFLVEDDVRQLFARLCTGLAAALLAAECASWALCPALCLPLLGLFVLLAAGVLGSAAAYFARRQKRLEEAAAQVRALLDGDATARLDSSREGQLYRLFHEVNEMAAVLNAHADREQREKQFLKNTMADISHQLKTPLAALNIYNGLLQAGTDDAENVRELAELSEQELDRMEQLVQSLLKLTRLDAGTVQLEKTEQDLQGLLEQTARPFACRARQEQKQLAVAAEQGVCLCCDRVWMREALKTSVYAACLFELLGYAATPAYGAQRNDIITSVETGSPEGMVALCGGVQAGSPVDSFAAPEPGDMPGYEDPVIMAAGAFTMGSSIELSADGPLRAPYTVYMQGGLNFAAARAGVLLGADRMLRLRRSE